MSTHTAGADAGAHIPTNPALIETFALRGIRVLGFLGIPFAFLLALFSALDAWQVSLTGALLMAGSIGLCFWQRWAAVLVCGICWFGLVTYVCDPFPGAPAGQLAPEELAFGALHLGVALLLTLLPPLCSRRLQNGLWTRPAANRPAAVVAVLAGVVWLWFHLHALVEWETAGEARIRVVALGITMGAALLALLWRWRSC